MRRHLAVTAALLGVGLATGAVATASGGTAAPSRTLLLVSGLDDHGLRELAQVPLLDRPGGAATGQVPDGALVQLVEAEGTWHRVRSVDAPQVEGWVDDFRLRGVVHLVGPAPSCAPVVGSASLAPGTQASLVGLADGGVLVSLVQDPAVGGVVPREALRQLPPSGPGRCDDVPSWATDGHVHQH